jgi:hypothetical protein
MRHVVPVNPLPLTPLPHAMQLEPLILNPYLHEVHVVALPRHSQQLSPQAEQLVDAPPGENVYAMHFLQNPWFLM